MATKTLENAEKAEKSKMQKNEEKSGKYLSLEDGGGKDGETKVVKNQSNSPEIKKINQNVNWK